MLIYCCNSRAEALHNLRHSIRRGSPHMCPLVTSGTYYIHRGTHTLGADAACPSLTCATCGMLATCFHARTDATVPISSGGSHQPNQSNHLCPSLRVLRWPSGKTLFLFFCSFFFWLLPSRAGYYECNPFWYWWNLLLRSLECCTTRASHSSSVRTRVPNIRWPSTSRPDRWPTATKLKKSFCTTEPIIRTDRSTASRAMHSQPRYFNFLPVRLDSYLQKKEKKKIIRQKLIKFLGCGAARTQLHTLSRRDKSNRIFGPRDLVRAHKLVSLVEPNVLAGNRRLLVCLRRRSLTRGVGESLCGAARNSIVLCDAHPITQFRFNSTDTTRNFTPIHQRPGTNHKVS